MQFKQKPLRIDPIYLYLLRACIHLVALTYISVVLLKGINGQLPGDPVQYLIDFTGISAFNLLILSLLISPLSEYFKFAQLIVVRKTLGVYAAVYAISHFLVFIVFELQFEWSLILSEVIKRPYISVGFVALLILTSLLVTSFKQLKKKMGTRWQKLHRWVYLALILICLHFVWSIKANELAPFIYISISFVLLLVRRKKIRRFFK